MQLTEEQQRVVDSRADSIVINAFAGTGKTSTLVAYAKARPQKKMLYIAFNKTVADEAKSRFPSYVEARTSHSLAYAAIGWKYQKKLGNIKPLHAAHFLRLDLPEHEATLLAALALQGVQKFCASSEADITPHLWAGQSIPPLASFDEQDVLKAARRLWYGMCDVHDLSIPMPHDGYLKLWQLKGASLSKYDTLLLDEAQDTNPCLYDIYKNFEGHKVLVGDTHQNIYTFRGAMNAMKRTKGEQHALTESFRFGPPIAEVANAILTVFKREVLSLRGRGESMPVGSEVQAMPTAILMRTNAGLFDMAAGLAKARAKTMDFGFVGGFKSYNPEQIMDTWHLMQGQRSLVRDPFLKSFATYDQLVEYAELTDDKELKSRIRVVEKYDRTMPKIMDQLWAIDAARAADAHSPWIVLTTAHRSKGLEWDQVALGDDFGELMHNDLPLTDHWLPSDSKVDPLPEEEANLIYVAATRARVNLILNSVLEEFMGWFNRISAKPTHKAHLAP